ncbi:L,D-transpeptidase family protein [Archangium primigenium]|uniref:L,D-transpeptidase family protein n=1 Tax=[Archangium] primigenium TaxID=2792470 RepID=UPI0019581B54|nr:L,D-transpeptidase family protein [Archangium primigenium]MBM7119026.1 L,D-transpeptidase family protein [Archangium primigenium]
MTQDSSAAAASPPAASALGAGSPEPLGNERFTPVPELLPVLEGKATLGAGAKGPAVRAVQQALVDLGFSLYGGADGAFGAQSTKAVRNFQIHARTAFPLVRAVGTVDAATLRALDALAPAPGQKGQRTHLPGPRYQGTPVRVVVVKNEHRTFLFTPEGQLQAVFGNAVGTRYTQTDSGLKKVTGKLDEAAAHALGQKLWGGPVFGPRLVDLSWATGARSGEELHGTNAPLQLGEDVSHGCIRHDNTAIVALYDALSVGDKVAIVDSINDPNLGPVEPPGKPEPGPIVASR